MRTGVITTVAGNGTAGFTGDGAAATSAELDAPAGLAFDKAGDIYIADALNNRVRKVAAGTGVITTVAGNGTTGTKGHLGDGGPATSGELASPRDVFGDNFGNIYIADQADHIIRMVGTNGIINTIAGTKNVAESDSKPRRAATSSQQ